METPPDLHELLLSVREKRIDIETALARLSNIVLQPGSPAVTEPIKQLPDQSSGIADLGAAQVDLDRLARCGFAEVVYGRGKTPEETVQIGRSLVERGQPLLVTLISEEQAALLGKTFPSGIHNPRAKTFRVSIGVTQPVRGKVIVVTAGTGDRPIAEEACETVLWMGCKLELIVDVGVAGPQRLLRAVPQLRTADAIVVVAGMEGALPSVVGGHVDCPIIAVPTSIGYGANFQGLSALLSMLNSCAANVAVVNIDSGFKGGYVAGLIASRTWNEG